MKNRIIFKTTSILMLLAFCSIPLIAQPPQGQRSGAGPGMGRGMFGQENEEAVKARVDNMAEAFELSSDQKAKLLEFEMELYKKNAIERQKLAGDREAMMSYMQEQREQRDKKYAEILTKEQLARYNELQQNRRPPGQGPEQPQEQSGELRQRGRGR